MKKNKFLYTDLCLIPLFVAVVFTGIVLHVAPFSTHDEWHNWAVAHCGKAEDNNQMVEIKTTRG